MNRYVNMISSRLSLRPPQQNALEILDRISTVLSLNKSADIIDTLSKIKNEYPSVSDFERDFPSLCFSLATGVGKTRLMGAFISYLHLKHGINNFFILAPNLTIYNKLITDFSDRNHPKYVFKGISEFAINQPMIITGDNYEKHDPLTGSLLSHVKINIFNISKITSETRKMKKLSEYIGESYFDYLVGLPDLVLLMDESHRYRAKSGLKTINELKPILGLELTATPFTETSKGAISFKNVVYDYPLGKAISDGFVKEPAVVTRKDFNPRDVSPDEMERIKLEDGIRLHESVKVQLETYARENGMPIVKPFLLVIARDTTHASQLLQLIQSDKFFNGRYKSKVIQVDSSKSGADEEEMITRLLKVESFEEPTEIVIHVNMLKEGWDVTNLYTIVPLRAANARVLIEQSIGRGLRLPYGERTGVEAVDRLNIISHDKFQEIIEEANKPDSVIQLKSLELDENELTNPIYTVVSQPRLSVSIGLAPANTTDSTAIVQTNKDQVFSTQEEQRIAQITAKIINKFENQPTIAPSVEYLKKPETMRLILKEVEEAYQPSQSELAIDGARPNVAEIIAKTVDLTIEQTINIPRIIVVPKGEVKSGFKPFVLKVESLNYPAVSEELWIQHLRTNRVDVIALSHAGINEARLEDYIVSGLIDFSDISYEQNANLLYDLASQAVIHFKSYLSEDELHRVLKCYQTDIAKYIHSQMQDHYWEESVEFDVEVRKGFTELKQTAYTCNIKTNLLDYRISPDDKSNMSKYLFNGFSRCLYQEQKFGSDSERKLAVILERDSIKWFKPVKGQFLITYCHGHEHREYQPDFIVENDNAILMIEVKSRSEMDDPIVLAKKEAAIKWCKHATNHASTYSGKPWKYILIPHDEVAENLSLNMLVNKYIRQVSNGKKQ